MNSVRVFFGSDLERFDDSGNWLVLEALVLALGSFSDSNDVDVGELRLESLDGLDVGHSAENAEVVSKLEIHGLLQSGCLSVLQRAHQANAVLRDRGDRLFVGAFFCVHTSEADFFELNWNRGAREDFLKSKNKENHFQNTRL